MYFRVLGHLRVDVDGRPVPVPPGKATVLLLRLLADVGEAVSVDHLVDALWPTAPPRDARAALQVKVSQLRAVLEPGLVRPADSTVVVSRGNGYLVPADAGHDVDAARFAKLVVDARSAAQGQRIGEARDLLGEALELWTAEPPFADVDDLWAVHRRARLVELHHQAREDRARLVLAAGDPLEPVVADLEALCAQAPLREPAHELLMRTLYRSGRQVEALTVYEGLRGRLADELGVDPQPALQELHRRILTQDPALDRPGRRTAPRPLPAPLTGFVDAGDRVQRCRALLAAARLVTLTGPGGTGKTRLAIEAARDGSDPDTWFADLTTVGRSDGVAEAVAGALGATPSPPDPLARTDERGVDPLSRIAELLGERHALLVLDNCEHVLDGAAGFAREALGRCEGLRILATSRQPLGIPGEAVWSLPPLGVPPPELEGADVLGYPAVELLADRLRQSVPDADVAGRDTALLAEIARRLDGIPLALELVAARARTLSLAAIVRRLDEHVSVLAGTSGVPERHRTLDAVVDWSWKLLDDEQQATAAACAVFHGPFDADDVVAVDPTINDRWEAEQRLLDLAERSLLIVEPPGPDGEPAFAMLSTIRDFAEQRLSDRGGLSTGQTAHLHRFMDIVAGVQEDLRGPDRPAVLSRLDDRAADLSAALDHALGLDDRDAALSLAVGLGWWWIHRRRTEGTHRLAAALECTGEAAPLLEADAYRWAAFVGQGTLPWDDVARLAEEASQRYAQLGSDLGRALCSLVLATCARQTSAFAAARTHASRAVEAFDELGDRWGLATATVISVDVDIEDPAASSDEQAVRDRIDHAIALFEELGDGWGHVHALRRRGEWLERRGDAQAAAEVLRSASDEAKRLGLDLAQA